MRSRFYRFRYPFSAAVLALLAAVLIIPGLVAPDMPAQAEDLFLERQAAALRPEYQDDLQTLAGAPRYSIEAQIEPESGQIAGTMVITYTNHTSSTLDSLPFRLFPNAGSIYGGGSLDVESARQGDAALETRQEQAATLLWVDLAEPLEPGAAASLALDFAAQVPVGASRGYGIYGRSTGLLSLAGWYPVLPAYQEGWQTPPVPETGDAMFAETSLYQVELRLPEGYTPVSTGLETEGETAGGTTTWRMVSGPAREFAVVVFADPDEPLQAQSKGTTINFFPQPDEGRAMTGPQQAIDILHAGFAAFSDRFGPYPFTEFDVVEAPITIGGYEFSGLVILDPAYRVDQARVDFEYIAAHEMAHQWWYGLVGNNTVQEPWLDEAVATYSAVLYREATSSRANGLSMLHYWEDRDGPRTRWSPPVNSPASDFTNWAAYRTAVYTHGALFIDQLRHAMGDEAFFAFLKDYQESYRYSIAATSDFLDLAQAHTDRDLSGLFSDWLVQ